MATNDQILLEKVFEESRANVAPTMSADDYFEVFSAEQTLKPYDLSYEEIEGAIIDGGNDGGVDSIFLFANGELVKPDTDLSVYKKDVALDLAIFQSKNKDGFSATAIDILAATLADALSFDVDFTKKTTMYNKELREAVETFRTAYTQLAGKFPTLRVTIYFTSRAANVHANVQEKADKLAALTKSKLSGAKVSIEFLGARELLERARTALPVSFGLALPDNPISAGTGGFICLVGLLDFYSFISDGAGKLRKHLFESNVRDYQGITEVNEGIRHTLDAPAGEDFWWLNNGITIIAADAQLSGGKVLTIKDPQVVNGLQTSHELHAAYTAKKPSTEPRKVLVRVLVTVDPASRDRVIKATNSQNGMQTASLRATDKLQRDIEEFFSAQGLFYDRRKNSYKNSGKPIDKIITIPYLAQAVMAVLQQEPHNSRGKPSSLLKKDDDYERVFSTAYPLSMFLNAAKVMRRIETFLRTRTDLVALEDRNNIKFHLAMFVVAQAVGVPKPNAKSVGELDVDQAITDTLLEGAAKTVAAEYKALGGTDQVAKKKDLTSVLAGTLVKKFLLALQ